MRDNREVTSRGRRALVRRGARNGSVALFLLILALFVSVPIAVRAALSAAALFEALCALQMVNVLRKLPTDQDVT
jgi:hypothetical protein